MDHFISCDWGTTNLRCRVIDSNSFEILAEDQTDQGISATNDHWNDTGKSESDRVAFFQGILSESVERLSEKSSIDLFTLPILISGMASSTIGMMELPYTPLPQNIYGSDLVMQKISGTAVLTNPIYLISGLCTNDDVLRGEETLLAGIDHSMAKGDHMILFPGTHSKHIRIQDGIIIDFKTYMTGEFFQLLSTSSILKNSIDLSAADAFDAKSFTQGVLSAADNNLLNTSFIVRTNSLFNKCTKSQNYFYLSGLLIGTEFSELADSACAIHLVTNDVLKEPYSLALNVLNIDLVNVTSSRDAMIRGQWNIFKAHESVSSMA